MLDKNLLRQSAAALAASLALAALSPAARAEAVTVDLGQAPTGTIDIFEVELRNVSCDEPQNFRFAARNTPWLKLVNGGGVRGVSRGKTKMFTAEINLTGLKPARYAGLLDVICETCGTFVLSSCHIDPGSIAIQVEVVERGARRGQGNGATVRALSE